MRKLLFLCCFVFLTGCFNSDSDDLSSSLLYESDSGMYELQKVFLTEGVNDATFVTDSSDDSVKSNPIQFVFHFKFTNTEDDVQKPINALKSDLIVENETDIEINDFHFISQIDDYNNVKVNNPEELRDNLTANVKPGVTVDILAPVRFDATEYKIDSFYLRNYNQDSANGDEYDLGLDFEEK